MEKVSGKRSYREKGKTLWQFKENVRECLDSFLVMALGSSSGVVCKPVVCGTALGGLSQCV